MLFMGIDDLSFYWSKEQVKTLKKLFKYPVFTSNNESC